MNYSKQTQSKPTCSEFACPEPVEGVEPISNVSLKKWGVLRMDYSYTVDETKKSV
jgi:hypothetical protein